METNDYNAIMVAPPGFKFDPKDDEVIRYYLMNKIHGHHYPWLSIIPEFDLYGERGPWDLLTSDESPVYVFAVSKNLSTGRKQRTCSFGTWKYQKNDEIKDDGQCIGYKSLLTFIPDAAKVDAAHQFGGSWHMSEFSVSDSKDKDCFVVCRVTFKYDEKQSSNKKKRSRQEMMPKNHASKKPRMITSSNRQGSEQCSTGVVDVTYSVINMMKSQVQQGVDQQCSTSAVSSSQEPSSSSSWSVMTTMAGDMIQGGGAASVLTVDEVDHPDLLLDLSEIDWNFDEVVGFL